MAVKAKGTDLASTRARRCGSHGRTMRLSLAGGVMNELGKRHLVEGVLELFCACSWGRGGVETLASLDTVGSVADTLEWG